MIRKLANLLSLKEAGGFVVDKLRGWMFGEGVKARGYYTFEVIRNGLVISSMVVPNTVANEGRNRLLDIGFHGAAAATWSVGLIDASPTGSPSSSDTMISHSGWAEFLSYSETVRQAWTTGTPVNQQVTNPTPSVFTCNASGSVRGFFITSSNVKGSTSGTLWSASTFSAVPVTSGDQVKVTYTLTIG